MLGPLEQRHGQRRLHEYAVKLLPRELHFASRRLEALFADDLRRRLRSDDENAGDGAVVAEERRVAVAPPRVSQPTASHDRDKHLVEQHRLATREDAVQQLAHDRPRVAPHLARALPHRPRVLLAEERDEAVVVEVDVLAAPEDARRLARVEHRADVRAKRHGPGRRRTERALRPVERPENIAGDAAAREDRAHLGVDPS